MKITELLGKTEDAYERLEAARSAHDYAVTAHTAAAEDAKARLAQQIEAANEERDRCVADAQASYDASISETERAKAKSANELASAESELEALRGQLNAVLGTDKSSRAIVRG